MNEQLSTRRAELTPDRPFEVFLDGHRELGDLREIGASATSVVVPFGVETAVSEPVEVNPSIDNSTKTGTCPETTYNPGTGKTPDYTDSEEDA